MLLRACLALTALLASAAFPALAGAATKLQGTVTWTTTATQSTNSESESFESKETRTVTMKVRMTKRAGAFGWQPEDNGSSYTGKYTLSSTRVERDSSGGPSCTTTNAGTGRASGKLPKKPRSTTPPALFASVLPSTATLGSSTKAIALRPILRYKGESTVVTTGSGLSPCQSGQDVDPIDGSLAPTDDATQICYPAGTSKRTTTPQAGTLMGAWKKGSRAFSFSCSKTFSQSEGRKVAVKVTGSLKAR
ncbi:MAG: hypothetical protein JHC84_09090 [Solirubrobacteraceae bacterium]|nr:hypothetical protein [Solirubrobacteraceae bacterium]